MSLLGSIRSYITKKISNTIAGATFNEEAFDEAHSSPLKLRDIDDEDSTPTHDTDEEWTNLIKVKEGARGVSSQVPSNCAGLLILIMFFSTTSST